MEGKRPILPPFNDWYGEGVSFHRGGSAPPMVEGSLNAVNHLNLSGFSNDPRYASCYYYNPGNWSPGIPLPVLSEEDWRSQRGLGGFNDNVGSSRFFEHNRSYNFNGGCRNSEWLSGEDDDVLGLPPVMQQSLDEILEDDPSTSSQYAEAQTYSSAVTQIFPGIGSHPTRSPDSEDIMSAFRVLNLSSGASQIDSGHTVLHGLRNSEGEASISLNQSYLSNSNLQLFSSSYFPSPSMTSSSDLISGYPSSYSPPLFTNSNLTTSSSYRDVEDLLYAKYIKAVEFFKSEKGSPRIYEHGARRFDAHLLGQNDHMYMAPALNPGRFPVENLHSNPGTVNTYGGDAVGFRVRSANGNSGKIFPLASLEELRNNKDVHLELPDIIGFVREFSTDQFGSRFIQQKLETASADEKNMIFKETLENAFLLITDVFGNYVIQKFFEHGDRQHIRELADKLYTRVLDFSLHTYGCRVIQKAVQFTNYDQQIKLVAELEGHVLMCVIDQNGNHVIQKCIEFVPEEAIQFIITSFYGNIKTLSTHAYGCRAVQRVVEHCRDSKTLKIIMDEILTCVCKLALDPFGNYVIQHILEHGKPSERSAIITTLAGHIVEMSQQKFASNVVEKCFTFGTPADRQLLITEMLGNTDENVPLQVMMKDQFGNYVVQKILETCNDEQRELILSRIKVHLNTLKKFTYGKHIVPRVERLVADGERNRRGQLGYSMKTEEKY